MPHPVWFNVHSCWRVTNHTILRILYGRAIPALLAVHLCSAVAAQQTPPAPTTHNGAWQPKLLFVIDPANDEDANTIASMTQKAYASNGVGVRIVRLEDIDRWAATAGPRLGEAMRDIKLIRYARSEGADLVGGVKERKSGYSGWLFNLRRCTRSLNMLLPEHDPTKPAVELLDSIDEGFPNTMLFAQAGRTPFSFSPRFDNIRLSTDDATAEPLECRERPMLGFESEVRQGNIVVTRVFDGSAARKVGIAEGDIIKRVAGKPASEQLLRSLDKFCEIGKSVEIDVVRAGKAVKYRIAPESFASFQKAYIRRWIARAGNDTGPEGLRDDRVMGHARPALVYFWATWCGPCAAGLPVYEMLAWRYHESDLKCIAVSVDEDAQAWNRLVSDNHLSGIQLRSRELLGLLGVSVLPTTLIVDANGNVGVCEITDAPACISLSIQHGGIRVEKSR